LSDSQPRTEHVQALRQALQWARTDPSRFAREILQLKRLPGEPQPGEPGYNPDADWELDAWQAELIEAIADVYRKAHGLPTVCNHEGRTYITVRACQGPGKTFGIAMAAHIFGFAFDPCVIPCVAPKLDHLKTRFMGEFSKIAHRAAPGYITLLGIKGTTVHWNVPDPANHLLICETGKQPENLQGLRRRFTLYLIDEASGVEEKLWPVTEGNLSATEIGIRVEIGNPTRNSGHFARSHLDERTAGDYYRMHEGPAQSRRIKADWVEKMTRSYGANSPVVRVRCYGEFAASDANQLLALEWLQAARNREVDAIRGDGSLPRLRISVDVAAGGDDETVITAFRHFDTMRVGLGMTRHSFGLLTTHIETADAAERLFNKFGGRKGIDDIVVDALGPGQGTAGELYARGHLLIPYQGGAGSSDPRRWRNRRVQSYMGLRNDLRDGTLTFVDGFFEDRSDWTDFDAQCCSVKTAPNSERLEDLTTKESMKRDGIKSPDMADSLAMQYATQIPQMLTAAIAARGQMERQPETVIIPSFATRGYD